MVKEKKSKSEKITSHLRTLCILLGSIILIFCLFILSFIYSFEKRYAGKIYPGVKIDGVSFGGKTKEEVELYLQKKSQPFQNLKIILSFEDTIATLSADELAVSYDWKLSALQAYLIGRSGYLLSDIYQRIRAGIHGISLTSILTFNTDSIDETLNHLEESITIPAQDATFQFENGKVAVFRPSRVGRELNRTKARKAIVTAITMFPHTYTSMGNTITIPLPVEPLIPKITTENSNEYGIKELLSMGTSQFAHSIPGRVHNVELGASRIHGHLIAPGDTFSFNEAVGDISSATGFAPAYIIKEGRTVLGDGGGICQVSTTLFRAALAAGLPIIERHAHAYRVGYYEQDSPPGLDATVFAPSIDLKFKNDTGHYILIQAKADIANYALTFELYGTRDGRNAEVTKPVILSQTLPPPDLYQDDPTLPMGIIKQVDWQAWGAKVNFDYKVTRDGEVLQQQSFPSTYRPWQAVFLRGTRS